MPVRKSRRAAAIGVLSTGRSTAQDDPDPRETALQWRPCSTHADRAGCTGVFEGERAVHSGPLVDAIWFATTRAVRPAFRRGRGQQIVSNIGRSRKPKSFVDFNSVADRSMAAGAIVDTVTRR
ncbi:DUF3604 domain-containing protein [uncultured Albimonas sp.]|uniref:DUF3604 domain-containing protein n=1 Tax=uncultured Albimonas sp. TaxID=1331701 RepID=UPI0030EEAF12|tara:strand:- start:907 stop:1275 length:369 start_codon:yes stop_codon:yes gene_type:complete